MRRFITVTVSIVLCICILALMFSAYHFYKKTTAAEVTANERQEFSGYSVISVATCLGAFIALFLWISSRAQRRDK